MKNDPFGAGEMLIIVFSCSDDLLLTGTGFSGLQRPLRGNVQMRRQMSLKFYVGIWVFERQH